MKQAKATSRIKIQYKGNDYVAEFDKDMIKRMERAGFEIGNIGTAPVTTMTDFLGWSLRKNHKNISNDLVEEMFESIPKKNKFLEKLMQIYSVHVETLLGDADGESAFTWTEE